MSGKCPTCGKGFGNWKNFSGRVSVYVHVCNTMYMYIHVCIHVYISILHALVCGNIHLFVFACTCSIMNKVHVHLSISTCTCTWMCISTTIKLNIFFCLQTFEGISCSWCGDAYHIGCFSDKLRDEPCHLGPLRNMIIPPSWIIKLPKIETVSLI